MAGIVAGCMAGIVHTINIGMAITLGRDSGMESISKDREAERGVKRRRAEAPAIGASALESFKPKYGIRIKLSTFDFQLSTFDFLLPIFLS